MPSCTCKLAEIGGSMRSFDRCPVHGHTQECEDNAFMHHAATGGDSDCICHLSRPAVNEEQR